MPRPRHTEDEYTRPDLVSARYRASRSAFFEAELTTTDVQSTANSNSSSPLSESIAPAIIRSFHPDPHDEDPF